MTQQRQVIEDRTSNLDYRGYNEVSKTNSSLRQQFRAHFLTTRGITWPIVKTKFGFRRLGYYPNSSSSFNPVRSLLLRAGDVERNPGDKRVCSTCQRAIPVKHRSLMCSLCGSSYHINCSGISTKQLRNLHASTQLQKLWPVCNRCHWSTLPFSTMTSEELINLFSDHDQATPELNTSDINNSSSSPSESPIEWFSAKVNGYYKNNLKIGHLNINSIFGKSDEVVNLLDKCAFDILFISESKIDGSVSSTLFAHPKYRIIRKDRKKGGGGLLVYIRSNVTAHRQIKLKSDGIESICLDVKGCAKNWFLICACYRSPGKCKITKFIPACATAAEKMYAKRKEIMFIGDLNMNMLKSSDNPNGPNKDLTKFIEQFCLTNVIHEATRTTNYSKTLLDVVLTSHPERLAKSGTLQVGISDHDLIFVVRKQKIPKPKARTIEFRTLKNLDQHAFLSDLTSAPWDSSYIYDNIDDIWSHWSDLY